MKERVHGVIIDAEVLGQGIYKLAEEEGLAGVIAFGMLPMQLMKSAEEQVRVHLMQEHADRYDVSTEIMERYTDQSFLDHIVKDIMDRVCVSVLAAAKRQDKMMA